MYCISSCCHQTLYCFNCLLHQAAASGCKCPSTVSVPRSRFKCYFISISSSITCTFCLNSSQFPSSSPSFNWLSSLMLSQDYSVDCFPCSFFDTIYTLASFLVSSWLSPASLIDAEADAPVFYQSFNATVNLWSKFYGRFDQAQSNSSCLKSRPKLCHLKFPSSPNPSHPNLGTNQGLSQNCVKSIFEFYLKPSLCPSSSEPHHFELVQSQLLHVDLLQLPLKLLNCCPHSRSFFLLNQVFASSWTHQGAYTVIGKR